MFQRMFITACVVLTLGVAMMSCSDNSVAPEPDPRPEPNPPVIVPAAPSTLVATRVSETTAHITWSDNSYNETGFEIQRLGGLAIPEHPLSWERITTVDPDSTECTVNAPSFFGYDFRVRAINDVGASEFSNEASICNWAVPVAPDGLTAAILRPDRFPAIGYGVILKWNDNSECESGFRIDRAVWNSLSSRFGGWTALTHEAAIDAVVATDRSVVLGGKYRYRVVALNAAGESPVSNTVEITVQ